MTERIFTSGRVGPLPAYLGYFFLRFPGTLGPEESWDLECLDTYDRRWTRQGRVWVRWGDSTFLVAPPSLFPLSHDVMTSFGLQKPLVLGRILAKVRKVEFTTPEKTTIEGQLVKVRNQSFLVLRGREEGLWTPLTEALTSDGLKPFQPEADFALVKDRGPTFLGPPTRPLPALTAPGAPFLLDRLKDGLKVARQYEKGIRDDVDTECLHQYRVWLRRVRSLASLGRMWELLPEWNRLKMVLRTLQQKTNELRDLDVLLLDFPGLQAAMPWDEGPKLATWESSLRRRRHAEFRRVKAWFESEEHRFAVDEVGRLLEDLLPLGEPWSVGDLTVSAFSRSGRSLKKALKNLGAAPADGALHEVRIQAKRLRYVLDALGGFGPPAVVKKLTGTLKEAQEGLGLFQDRSILLERLKGELDAWRTGHHPDTLAFGILVGLLVADQGNRRKAAVGDCRRLQSKAFLKALERLIEPPEAPYGT